MKKLTFLVSLILIVSLTANAQGWLNKLGDAARTQDANISKLATALAEYSTNVQPLLFSVVRLLFFCVVPELLICILSSLPAV